MSLVEINNLNIQIATPMAPVHPVRGVSLTLQSGKVLGVVGESGCGKSITSMAIAGLFPPHASVSANRFVVNGRDMRGATEQDWRSVRRRSIGVIFQNPMKALNPRLLLGAQLREAMLQEDRTTLRTSYIRALELLDAVGVDRASERLRQYPHELSGGLAQRVVIALALARHPRLLIADEPTTALDVSVQAQVLNLLGSLMKDFDLGVLLVTHDLDVIRDRADDVAVMYAGKIVETGPTHEVIKAPSHPYTAALLAAMPNLNRGRDNPLVGLEGQPPPLVGLPVGCAMVPRCPLRSDLCQAQSPELIPVEGKRHFAACHNNGGRAVHLPAMQVEGLVYPSPPNASDTLIVEASGVTKSFTAPNLLSWFRTTPKRDALDNVSIAVREGESLGIVGESGSGKTTLARMLIGLETPDSGSIRFRGQPVTALDAGGVATWRSEVAFVFQDSTSSLNPRFSVAESVGEPLLRTGMNRADREKAVLSLLNEVGLSAAHAERRPYQLSGGQRQRVGIARGLALNPRLLIADEPVSALDVSVQATILNLLNRLRVERKMSYAIISHDLGVIRYVCSHIAVVCGGKIVESGTIDEVLRKTRHPYTMRLLDSVPGSPEYRQATQAALA